MDAAGGVGTPELEVRLLGPLSVVRGGDEIGLAGHKPRALLAVLALEPGHVVSVDALVEALWPGEPPDTAAHAVQVYVSQLRKALGPVIATRPPGYALELAPDRIDVHCFTSLAAEGRAALEAGDAAEAEIALREALALWRGPALADFVYEPFAQTHIARLEDFRATVLEERIEADLALGRHVQLVSELEALAQADRLRERPRAQLMLALYRSGRQADALTAYRHARETLVEELGIEPGPELKELESAILRQDDSLRLEDAAVVKPTMKLRRLAVILSVDVVNAMAFGETLDAEALADVERRYLEVVDEAISRHGGTIEAHVGDTVTAAFGTPVAHEDDALRAARAAIDLHTMTKALGERLDHVLGAPLRIRVGIAAGDVVATRTALGRRVLAGDPVGIAAGLQHAARPGEIVVGEVVARLIDHAAVLEPSGTLDVPGRRAPLAMFRLHAISAAPPAFEQRLDAPLVGRKRELAALRRSLRRAVDSGSTRVAVVVAPPGVGKSRLVAEFTRRSRGITALWGRCLSYGDGITYWPLREVLARAGESEERDAILAALEAETPPPAPEIAWLFRRFCEASVAERALVLVFDDVHWAEPTFLELVEHLADRGEAPIHIVCLAREELREMHPSFLEGRANTDRIDLDVLSVDETDALVDALGGAVLESDQRTLLVETVEGNPLFLEQLLALALEGGLGVERPPETIQALLAARLDRLGPGERAVLERGAVVGKEFSAGDVVALLDSDAAPTADAHLATLVGRGFVRPGAVGVFGFRHVLVQDAVYRAAPKRLRAELHERYADRLDVEQPDLPDLDEFVGYHLEQAYRLRTELGEVDRRSQGLAETAGRRLGAAGFRALKRGDMPATVALLGRAVSLLPHAAEARNELMCELGIARSAVSDEIAGAETFLAAIEGASAAGQRRIVLRAQIEAAYARLNAEPEGSARELLSIAEGAIPTLEAFGDERSLARAWLFIGYVRGGIHGDHAAWVEAEVRALDYYRRTGFPPTTCLQQIAGAIYWGSTAVPLGIEKCASLLADETIGHFGRAAILPFLGGLHAQAGQFTIARSLIDDAGDTLTNLGAVSTLMVFCGTVRADVELLAGDLEAAEATLREQCEFFARTRNHATLAVRAAKLAEALLRQGRLDEATEWSSVSRSHAASDDLSAQLVLGPVEARLLARRGNVAGARELAEAAARLADGTDGLNLIASARLALAEVLRAAELLGEARSVAEEAVHLFERKGNVVAATHARDLLELEVPA